MIKLTMPSYGISEAGGVVLKWLKSEGDAVQKSEPVVEIESEKATVELEAPASAILAQIVATEGEEVAVGATLALFSAESEQAELKPARQPPERAGETPAAGSQEAPAAPPLAFAAARQTAPSLKASPSARRIAREHGLDLNVVRGTGPQGRIVRADVERHIGPAKAAARSISSDREAVSPTRRVIAERMTQSVRTVPHIQLSMDVDATQIRRFVAEAAASRLDISITALLAWATAATLADWPRLNASWHEDHIERYQTVHLSVAIASERGLLAPVIRDADSKGIRQIDAELRDLIGRVRAGRIGIGELTGGTFTLSNLGMFGVRQFDAIINPPQSAILAAGALEERPFAKDGLLGVRTEVTLTLAADHRVVDGAEAAGFLRALRERLEDRGLASDQAREPLHSA